MEYLLNTKVDRKIKTKCLRCKGTVNHTIIANYSLQENDIKYSCWSCTDYEIIRCNGCDLVSFREEYRDDSCIDFGPDGEVFYSEIESRYPSVISSSKFKEYNINHIPYVCRKIYEETEFSIENEQIFLSAIGLRTLIESICNDQIQIGNIKFKSKNTNLLKSENIEFIAICKEDSGILTLYIKQKNNIKQKNKKNKLKNNKFQMENHGTNNSQVKNWYTVLRTAKNFWPYKK